MADLKSKTMKELAEQLVGKEVKLSPSTAFFVDPAKQFTLNAYGDESRKIKPVESVIIQEGWKLREIMKNIVAGIIRVIDPKSKEDISTSFGGPEAPVGRNKTEAIVEAPKQVNLQDERDKHLHRLLDNTMVEKVLQVIGSSHLPFDSLERLLELEIQGENSSFVPRGPVVDGIKELMKNTSGLGKVGQVADKGDIKVARK